VLTSHGAGAPLPLWSAAPVGAAIVLLITISTSADAGGIVDLNCLGGARSFNCVAQWATPGDPYIRIVPEALGEAEKAHATAQDRKWLTRCRPVIEHDRFGVARYHYSAPGCEFGVGAE
jgi:hypothetical protein